MSPPNSLLVVCGLHRSGTTYIGEILKCAGIWVVHEPLNERFGVKGVPLAYPFVGVNGGEYASLLDEINSFQRPWNRSPKYLANTGLKRKLFELSGGRSGLRWSYLMLRNRLRVLPRQICLKDPFSSLSTPYLLSRYNARAICMVRHPAAIHYSTEKQGWWFDVNNLLKQPELIAEHGAEIPEAHWKLAQKHHAASIALLWKFMFIINFKLKQNNQHLLMLSHENLCLTPKSVTRQICDHFGIPYTQKIERFVTTHSEGNSIEAPDGRTHGFKRDSKALPDIWRNRISSQDEELIHDIAGKEVIQFFGEW